MIDKLFYEVDQTQTMRTALPIKCLEDGRWSLTANFDLVDSKDNKIYQRPSEVDLDKVVFENVTDMGANPVPLILLFTLAVKPLYHVSKDNILDPAIGIKVTVTNGSFTGYTATQVYWDFPETGVPHADNGGAYMHVPGASDFVVNAQGQVRQLSTDSIITPGTNRGNKILVKSDVGIEEEVEIPKLVLAAFGKYKYDTATKEPIFLDGDSSNIALANLSLDMTVDTAAARAATTNEELRVTNTIIEPVVE
ncbi:hypothetical protein [Vibrio phage BONAISHI]|nr:hypothetical protein [Vibrio phage BONAISHI]